MKLFSFLRYRRPKKVDPETYRQARKSMEESEGSVRSGLSGASSGIPEALSFDRIINGGTCPVRAHGPLFSNDPLLMLVEAHGSPRLHELPHIC